MERVVEAVARNARPAPRESVQDLLDTDSDSAGDGGRGARERQRTPPSLAEGGERRAQARAGPRSDSGGMGRGRAQRAGRGVSVRPRRAGAVCVSVLATSSGTSAVRTCNTA